MRRQKGRHYVVEHVLVSFTGNTYVEIYRILNVKRLIYASRHFGMAIHFSRFFSENPIK